ncbi:MAG: DHH family phosphoesterase [Actinomycetota bacterium]
MDKAKEIEKVSHIISTNHSFLIITHLFPDGDSLGSQSALHNLFKAMGKKSYMLCTDQVPYQYKYLPSVKQVKKSLDGLGFDSKPVTFCLDCADEKRMGIDYKRLVLESRTVINIDHHINNSNYGLINIVNPKKAATAQMIYDIITGSFPSYLNKKIAAGIYTGILTDTGKFQYENTTAEVHKIVSHLLEFGIVPAEIFSQIYENDPLNRFKLLELVFKRINFIKSKNLIYSYVLQKDFNKLRLPFSAQDGIIELLRSVEGVKIAAFIKQIGDKRFKVSLRSSDQGINVANLALRFGGGGHRMAAAYSCSGDIDKIAGDLIGIIEKHQSEL